MVTETGMTMSEFKGGEVGIFNPEAQLDMAIRASKALARVVAGKKKPVIINGEQYLEFEDWQTLGQFDGVSVKTGDAEMVEIDGVKGAKAKAYLINNRTGEIIGGAEAYCMRDEEKWGTRPKYEWQGEGDARHRVKVGDEVVPWFQLASMAQTRAGSKALRNKEAWIAVLAGYRPTPAEEMTDGTVSPAVQERRTVDDDKHWCAEHNTAFFKKGKMASYAHPLKNANGEPVIDEKGKQEWCHEPSEVKGEPSKYTGTGPVKVKSEAEKESGDQSEAPEIPEFDGSAIANFGELWSRCKNYGISKTDGLKLYGVNDQVEISTPHDETWRLIFSKRFNTEVH